MHTHLSGESNPKRYMERFTMDLDDYAYRSIQFAERTLMAGFTTVRDLGGPVNTSLRDAINKEYLIGPRIYSTGKSLATTGGHADPTNGMRFELMGNPGPEEGVHREGRPDQDPVRFSSLDDRLHFCNGTPLLRGD